LERLFAQSLKAKSVLSAFALKSCAQDAILTNRNGNRNGNESQKLRLHKAERFGELCGAI
jgi:hypothetical protein